MPRTVHDIASICLFDMLMPAIHHMDFELSDVLPSSSSLEHKQPAFGVNVWG